MDKTAHSLYRVKQLLPGVFGISSKVVISYLVVGKTGALLIDTAYGFADLRQIVQELTPLPITVVNTHGHIDHTGGNFYFDNPVCIHEADVAVYKRHNSPQLHRYAEQVIRPFQIIFFWRSILPKHPEANDNLRMNFDNFRFVREGESFDLGGLTPRIVEIPGHTQGSIAVLIPEKRLVFTSDGANPDTWLFLPESTNLSTYAKSLRKLESLDFDHMLTGHTEQLFPKRVLSDWIAVAENPDRENGRPVRGNAFAPGVKPVRYWAKGIRSKKGMPSILADPHRLD